MLQEKIAGPRDENVVLEVSGLSLTVLPAIGGKIASIRIGEKELLQAPLVPYALRSRTMAFDESDASGWDECLPSVAACSVDLADSTSQEIPDHGDLWRVRWQDVTNGGQVEWDSVLVGCGLSLPLKLERAMKLIQTENGWRLNLLYSLNNTGSIPLPWSWAAHPLFAVEAGDRIILPDSIDSLRLEGSGGNRLGKGGDHVLWPIAKLAEGGETDLSLAQSIESGIGDKLFAGPLSATENWCALERPSAGVTIRMSFNPVATPFLGLWICYGGWPDRPGAKQMGVALEPSTAPVDSLAVTGPWSRTLAAGESFSWPMTVEIQSKQV